MAIVGQNALLNQYMPTFYIRDLRDGQTLVFDSVRKAFVNAEGGGGSGGVDRLGELLDVSDSVDNPLSLQDGQSLVYNNFTNLWENRFVDYNTLLNRPTLTNGTVTSVSVLSSNGIISTVSNPTTTPSINLSLGDITPLSITSTGAITGSNLSGINTGDQTITLTGDVTGSGTGTFVTTLANVNSNIGTFGNGTNVPQITVDAKGRITGVVNIPISESGIGTVTNVSAIGNNGVNVFVDNPTSTPEITIGLGDITPTSVSTTGTISASNFSGSSSGTNTGDQTITLTGDVTGSGTGTFATTLATVNLNVGTFGNGTNVPQITVDAKGRITGVVNVPISESGIGTVTNVSAIGNNGVTVSVNNPTSTPEITVGLGNITPTSVSATGTISASNFSGSSSGTNTGDQTIVISGDASGSGTGPITLTLETVNLAPGTYGDDHFVPTITVNEKGLVTSVTTQHVDTTVRDLIPLTETIVVQPRHQYIVTSELEVEGYIINNGVIAIL